MPPIHPLKDIAGVPGRGSHGIQVTTMGGKDRVTDDDSTQAPTWGRARARLRPRLRPGLELGLGVTAWRPNRWLHLLVAVLVLLGLEGYRRLGSGGSGFGQDGSTSWGGGDTQTPQTPLLDAPYPPHDTARPGWSATRAYRLGAMLTSCAKARQHGWTTQHDHP